MCSSSTYNRDYDLICAWLSYIKSFAHVHWRIECKDHWQNMGKDWQLGIVLTFCICKCVEVLGFMLMWCMAECGSLCEVHEKFDAWVVDVLQRLCVLERERVFVSEGKLVLQWCFMLIWLYFGLVWKLMKGWPIVNEEVATFNKLWLTKIGSWGLLDGSGQQIVDREFGIPNW